MAPHVVRAPWTQSGKRWPVYMLVMLTCAVAGTTPARAQESTAGTEAPPSVRGTPPNRRTRDPADALAKRLDLTVQQTVQVRRLLAIRRSQMRALWTDDVIAADDRVGAVKVINERTEAQIRALLTEEQRKGYIQPRPSGSPATDPKPSVEQWLNVNRLRQPNSSATAAPDPTPK